MSRAIPRILVAHIDPDEVRPIIEQRFPDAPVRYVDDPAAVTAVLAEHDPKIAFTIKQGGFEGSFHRAILNHPGLNWFHVGGSGYEHIQPWGTNRPAITNCAGVLAAYLAETVLGGILTLNGHFLDYGRQQRQRRWRGIPFKPLSEQTLLVVGLGQIGGIVAQHGRHLGMRVLATRRSNTPHPAVHELHRPEDLPELLPQADFVSLHVRLSDETRHLIDAAALAKMRKGSFLVNTSRGPVVDESALAEALRSGHIAAAYLDVFETEPLPEDSELWDLPNLFITPHASDNVTGWAGKFAELFVDNLQRWLDDEPMHNLVSD